MPKIKIATLASEPDLIFFDVIYSKLSFLKYNDATVDSMLLNPLCLITRNNLFEYPSLLDKVNLYLRSPSNKLIFFDPNEGAVTTIETLKHFGLWQLATQGKILIISSGDFSNSIHFCNVDQFIDLTVAHPFSLYSSINNFESVFNEENKEFTFLFLNKIAGPHRKELIQQLNERLLLNKALWSDLSEGIYLPNSVNEFFNGSCQQFLINETDFTHQWPDGVIFSDLYNKTYFSVVTETNFDYPYAYRTEKTYKVLLAGHPFIIASLYKFYENLRSMGFKTFEGIIDESFDLIEDDSKRMQAITNTIEQLCNSNLSDFLKKAKPICEYNQRQCLLLSGTAPITRYNTLTNFLKDIDAEN